LSSLWSHYVTRVTLSEFIFIVIPSTKDNLRTQRGSIPQNLGNSLDFHYPPFIISQISFGLQMKNWCTRLFGRITKFQNNWLFLLFESCYFW